MSKVNINSILIFIAKKKNIFDQKLLNVNIFKSRIEKKIFIKIKIKYQSESKFEINYCINETLRYKNYYI